MLAKGKLETMCDCVATSWEFAKNFKTDTIRHAFVDTGVFDTRSKLCPDIDGIVSIFKIDWTKVIGEKAWFYLHVPAALKEVYLTG